MFYKDYRKNLMFFVKSLFLFDFQEELRAVISCCERMYYSNVRLLTAYFSTDLLHRMNKQLLSNCVLPAISEKTSLLYFQSKLFFLFIFKMNSCSIEKVRESDSC